MNQDLDIFISHFIGARKVEIDGQMRKSALSTWRTPVRAGKLNSDTAYRLHRLNRHWSLECASQVVDRTNPESSRGPI